MSFGTTTTKSDPVTWRELMTPWQKTGMQQMAPMLTSDAMAGFQGYGFTPGERKRRKTGMMSGLSEMAGGMRGNVRDRTASLGQFGGVASGAMENIDAAKIMAMGQGLGGLQAQEEAAAKEKINRLLSFVTWNPPQGQRSEGGGVNAGLK